MVLGQQCDALTSVAVHPYLLISPCHCQMLSLRFVLRSQVGLISAIEPPLGIPHAAEHGHTQPKRAPQRLLTALARELRRGTSKVYFRADLLVSRRPGDLPARQWRAGGPYMGRTPGNARKPPAGRCRAETRRHGPDRPRITPMAASPGARAVYGGCQSHFPTSPKLRLSMLGLTASTSSAPSGTCSGQFGDAQPHPTGTLIASVATLLGAERLGRLQIALPSRNSVKSVITANHPVPFGNPVSFCELGFCCGIRGVAGTISGCCCRSSIA